MIKKIVFSLLLVLAMSAYSQHKNINNYKYIIVKEKLDFFKKSDQYQTSSLTKFLLQKKGFTVFLSNEKLPENLLLNRCLALTADIVEESNMFSVKNKIVLKDCYGKLVYSSGEGKSKEKDYKKGYQEAIRRAYTTMTDVEYKEVKGAILLPVNKTVIPVVKESIPVKKAILTKAINPSIKVETLYAQVKPNGFQLVNTTPAIVFKILKTNINDVFVIKGKDGLIYKKGNIWVAEYYENTKLVVKQYDIKF